MTKIFVRRFISVSVLMLSAAISCIAQKVYFIPESEIPAQIPRPYKIIKTKLEDERTLTGAIISGYDPNIGLGQADNNVSTYLFSYNLESKEWHIVRFPNTDCRSISPLYAYKNKQFVVALNSYSTFLTTGTTFAPHNLSSIGWDFSYATDYAKDLIFVRSSSGYYRSEINRGFDYYSRGGQPYEETLYSYGLVKIDGTKSVASGPNSLLTKGGWLARSPIKYPIVMSQYAKTNTNVANPVDVDVPLEWNTLREGMNSKRSSAYVVAANNDASNAILYNEYDFVSDSSTFEVPGMPLGYYGSLPSPLTSWVVGNEERELNGSKGYYGENVGNEIETNVIQQIPIAYGKLVASKGKLFFPNPDADTAHEAFKFVASLPDNQIYYGKLFEAPSEWYQGPNVPMAYCPTSDPSGGKVFINGEWKDIRTYLTSLGLQEDQLNKLSLKFLDLTFRADNHAALVYPNPVYSMVYHEREREKRNIENQGLLVVTYNMPKYAPSTEFVAASQDGKRIIYKAKHAGQSTYSLETEGKKERLSLDADVSIESMNAISASGKFLAIKAIITEQPQKTGDAPTSSQTDVVINLDTNDAIIPNNLEGNTFTNIFGISSDDKYAFGESLAFKSFSPCYWELKTENPQAIQIHFPSLSAFGISAQPISGKAIAMSQSNVIIGTIATDAKLGDNQPKHVGFASPIVDIKRLGTQSSFALISQDPKKDTFAKCISADGRVIGGTTGDLPAIWIASGVFNKPWKFVPLSKNSNDVGVVNFISANAEVICGSVNKQAMMWLLQSDGRYLPVPFKSLLPHSTHQSHNFTEAVQILNDMQTVLVHTDEGNKSTNVLEAKLLTPIKFAPKALINTEDAVIDTSSSSSSSSSAPPINTAGETVPRTTVETLDIRRAQIIDSHWALVENQANAFGLIKVLEKTYTVVKTVPLKSTTLTLVKVAGPFHVLAQERAYMQLDKYDLSSVLRYSMDQKYLFRRVSDAPLLFQIPDTQKSLLTGFSKDKNYIWLTPEANNEINHIIIFDSLAGSGTMPAIRAQEIAAAFKADHLLIDPEWVLAEKSSYQGQDNVLINNTPRAVLDTYSIGNLVLIRLFDIVNDATFHSKTQLGFTVSSEQEQKINKHILRSSLKL
jgi:hypothetical protein